MKNLENLNLQELSTEELTNVDGGGLLWEVINLFHLALHDPLHPMLESFLGISVPIYPWTPGASFQPGFKVWQGGSH